MKNDSLDGLRGVAALSVIFSHMLFSFFPYLGIFLVKGQDIPQAYWWERYAVLPIFQVFFNGSFAVSIFFVLSGYVLTIKFFATCSRKTLYSGAIKRYPRLIIPTAASVMFAWVLLSCGLMNTFRIPELGGAGWPLSDYSHAVPFHEALWDAWIGAAFQGHNLLNAPLWTIGLELIGSFVLFGSYIISGSKHLVVAFLCFTGISLALSGGSIIVVHFLAMFAGSAVNRAVPFLKRHQSLCLALIVLGLVGGGMDYSVWYAWVPEMAGHERLITNTVGGILLVSGVIGHSGAAKVLSSKFPDYLGRMSFATYLLHWPIICSFSFGASYFFQFYAGLGQQAASFITMSLTLALAYGTSHFFVRFVEKPATTFAARLSDLVLTKPNFVIA